MKKIFFLLAIITLFGSCQKSLEDRAAKELREYTQKNCPTPVVDGQNTDSAVYEPSSRTIHYYYKLHDKIDNQAIIAKNEKTFRAEILKQLKTNTKSKAFKDAGFTFRYTYRSASKPDVILLDETFVQKDYK